MISETFEANSESGSPWQNPVNQFDVTGDNNVSPIDVLHLIVAINDGIQPQDAEAPYLDVSGDGFVTPRDVLMVISYINDQSDFAASVGQSAAQATDATEVPANANAANEAVFALFGGQGEPEDDDNEFWV